MGIIRAYLALSVAIWHISDGWEITINGYLTVICFYIISGYYMSMVLNRSYVGPGSTLRFYGARYLRLFPAYAVVAVAAILFWHHVDPARIAMPEFSAMPLTWLFTVMANASIFGLDTLKMITVEMPQLALPRLIGPGWSLGIELLFYAAAPFVIRRGLRFSLAVFAILLAIRLCMLPFAYDPWRYYFAPSVLCFFLLGHIAERLAAPFLNSQYARRFGLLSIISLPFAGYLAGVNIVRDIDRWDTWIFLLLFAGTLPFVFAATRRSRLDSAIGSLSYPLYLVHQLSFTVIGYFLGESSAGPLAESPARTAAGVGVALAIAYILHIVVERPVEAIRNRFKSAGPTKARGDDAPSSVVPEAPNLIST